MSYTTRLQVQFMASRDEGFAWKHEDTTPQDPNSSLLPDVAKAAHVCPHASAPSW